MENKKQDALNFHVRLSPFLFILCLFFPSYYLGSSHEAQYAFLILILGWFGLIFGYVSWIANILYLIALMDYKNIDSSLLLSIIALILALSFLRNDEIVLNAGIPSYISVTKYGVGYYLWIASISIFVLGQLIKKISDKKNFQE